MEPLQAAGITLEFTSDPEDWSPEQIRRYDVLVLSKSNGKPGATAANEDRDWLTDKIQENVLRYVEQGGGLLVCHSGTVGYRDKPDFLGLVGGVFEHHPPHCPVTLQYSGSFGREETDPDTIIVHDEHYFVTTTGDIETFLTSVSDNGTQPAGWTRRQGEGRVCVLTPGHFSDVWAHSVYQHTLRQALTWSAGARTE
jgi:type 1 glutamine amidotransferase